MLRALCLSILLLSTLPAASPRAGAQTPVKIGTSGGVNTIIIPLHYARDAGLFSKAGLDVELVDLNDDTTAVQSLIANQFPVLYTGAGSGIIAIARGADIKLVDAFGPWTDYQFVAVPEVHTLKDMEGRLLGVSRIGSVSYLAPVYALQKEGVDVDKVKFLAVGNDSTRGRALAARSIQGAVINGLDASRTLEADPSLHIIYDVGSAFRQVALSNGVFARGDMIRDKPQVVATIVKVLVEASRALQSDKAAAVAQAVKSGLPKDSAQATYDRLFQAPVAYYGVDGGLDPVAIMSTVKLLQDSGDVDKAKTPSVDQIVDGRFVAKAINDLGPYKK